MKIFEFANSFNPKTSPYINDMQVLVNYARAIVDADLVKVIQVPISKILFTQSLENDAENTSVEEFDQYASLPFAVLVDGFYHLLDGHHRINSAIESGNTRVLIFVADADDDEITEGRKKRKQSSKSPVIPFVGHWWYGGSYGNNYDDSDSGETGDFGGGDGGGE